MHLPLCATILLLGAPSIAQGVAKVIRCAGVFERIELARAVPEHEDDWRAHVAFEELITAWIRSEPELLKARRRSSIHFTPDRDVMLVSADKVVVDAVEAALSQLKREDLRDHVVLCTFVTMPAGVAKAHGLEPRKVTAVEQAVASQLLKAAVAKDGALLNLPEAKGLPLVPFFAQPATAKPGIGSSRPAAKGEAPPCIECVALPTSGRDVLLQILVGPDSVHYLRLEAGSGVLLWLPAADAEPAPERPDEGAAEEVREASMVRVLWLRYGGTAPHGQQIKVR